jgi:hypothetical protein
MRGQENIKSDGLKQMYLNMNDKIAITLEYFNLRSSAVWESKAETYSSL